MDETKIHSLLTQSKTGNELAREKIVLHYKPYVLNVVGQICKRYISWSDEEASIGLIAFNQAIDSFEDTGGRTFVNYAYLLIQRELIDYFRKEKRATHLSFHSNEDETGPVSLFERDKSVEQFEYDMQASQLVEEILELDAALQQYNISFEELEHYSPKHRDTREALLHMVHAFLELPECVDEFIQKKRIPVKEFIKETGFHKKTIERHRKYLVTLILLKINPQWVRLAQYVQGENGEEDKSQ